MSYVAISLVLHDACWESFRRIMGTVDAIWLTPPSTCWATSNRVRRGEQRAPAALDQRLSEPVEQEIAR